MKDTNNFLNNIIESLKERFSSPFYVYFVMSWILWNWKIFYITLFVDGEILDKQMNISKLKYVLDYLNESTWSDSLFLGPFTTTLFLICLAPFFTRWIYTKVIEDKYKTVLINQKFEEVYTKKSLDLAEEKINLVDLEEKLKLKDPNFLWKKDFEEFSKSFLYKKFSQVIFTKYSNHGLINEFNDSGHLTGKRFLDEDILAYADSANLIVINNNRQSDEEIDLTEKGKFFVLKYQESNINKITFTGTASA
ncbi:MAG: hypothetical protein KA007_00975 [Candidatus Pacebacteria bacterium]|nr:hypothetical protein [Candidatus Paceibacterota bacterium]